MEQQIPQCDCDVLHEDVVNHVREQMPDRDDFTKLSEFFKMFSDGTRIQILWALECSEMCVCDLAVLLNMTKSAISHQLKSLRLSNLVKSRREGKVVFYSLADDHVKSILDQGFVHIKE
ncbi:MAG TPA: transcriptional regulator [Clostridiales bacterium]|nr:transcriptional regulator [Clostridiales bacterium]